MGNLDDLREASVRRLAGIPALSGVPVIPEDRQNILTEIRKGLATGGGLVLTVGTGNARGVSPNLPIPQADVELILEAAEIPAINRAASGKQLPAISAVVIAIVALHHYAWESGRTLVFDELQYDKDDKTKIVIYTAIFKTRVSFEAQLGV